MNLKILYTIIIVIVFQPYSSYQWSYSEVDDLVLFYDSENDSDAITYQNVKNSLRDKPRIYNDTLCISQFKEIFNSARKREKWALKALDSWGSLPSSGLLSGRLTDLGDYDECVNVAHDFGNNNNIFVGQYCLVSYPLEELLLEDIEYQKNPFSANRMPSFFRRGVCIPDSCSTELLNELFTELISNETRLRNPVGLFKSSTCYRLEYEEFSGIDIFALVIFSVLAVLLILSTTYDFLTWYFSKKQKEKLIIFSIITNSRKLFKTEKKNGPAAALECLNGLRVFSILWIVYGHKFFLWQYEPTINYRNLWNWVTQILTMIIVSAPMAVDTFFVLSGFLLGYYILKEMDKRGKLTLKHIIWMYIHRYIRLFPILAATLLFTVTFLGRIGDGPYWNALEYICIKDCRKYWWSSLLYVQNIVNPKEMCLYHTWYLSADTQLYILSPLILIPLHKWGRKFIPVIISLILASSVYVYVTSVEEERSVRILETLLNIHTGWNTMLYFNIHTRAAPWLVGIILAFFLRLKDIEKYKLPKIIVLIAWPLSFAIMTAVIFAPYEAQQVDAEPDITFNASYSATSRLAWSLAISWIIFACHQGIGGIINSILSYSHWQFIARLTYAIYVTHGPVQALVFAKIRTDVDNTIFDSIHKLFGDYMMTFILSIIVVLVFESPIIALERVLMRRRRTGDSTDIRISRVSALRRDDIITSNKFNQDEDMIR